MTSRVAPVILLLLVSAVACDSADHVVNPDPVQVRMAVAPVQCGGNAWEQAGMSVEAYYASLGVELHEIETSNFATDTCLSCACPTGERIDVRADELDVALLLQDGFVRTEDWPYGP